MESQMPEREPDATDYDYPYDDDIDGDDDTDAFECAAYWTGAGWHCPLAGSEDCDWECTETFEDEPSAGPQEAE